MLSQTNSIDLNTRHGNILGCAEVVHALHVCARQNGRYDKLLYINSTIFDANIFVSEWFESVNTWCFPFQFNLPSMNLFL